MLWIFLPSHIRKGKDVFPNLIQEKLAPTESTAGTTNAYEKGPCECCHEAVRRGSSFFLCSPLRSDCPLSYQGKGICTSFVSGETRVLRRSAMACSSQGQERRFSKAVEEPPSSSSFITPSAMLVQLLHINHLSEGSAWWSIMQMLNPHRCNFQVSRVENGMGTTSAGMVSCVIH